MSPAFAPVRLQVALSDEDRGVWEELTLATAQHPSETAEFLATRFLACCLRWQEGIAFSTGVCAGDEPALAVRELDGRIRAWIEVGLPDPDRLHRAAKRAEAVSVFPHRASTAWRERCRSARVHRASQVEVVEIEPGFLGWLAESTGPRARWDVWVAAGEVRIAVDGRERATHPRVTALDDA